MSERASGRVDSQRQDGGRLALYCIVSVALMVADHHSQYVEKIRAKASYVAWPLLQMIRLPFTVGQEIGHTIADNRALAARNQELEKRWLQSQARLARAEALAAENTRLRALLDSSARLGDRVLVGELIRANLDPFVHRVAINRGSADGVFVGQPVAAAAGMVGQIEHVASHHAYVRLITDPSHALPVTVQRSGARTIAYGTGSIDALALTDLPRSAEIQIGDLLVTSGLGGRFPPGYPVARVGAVSRTDAKGFLSVTATPTARLDRFREVLLVWPASRIEVTEPSASEAAAAPTTEPSGEQTTDSEMAEPSSMEVEP